VTAAAASASIATGTIVNLGLELLIRQTVFDWPALSPFQLGVLPAAVALAASFTVLFAVSRLTGRRRPPDIDPDIGAVMDL
jgi:hypothetical protein